MKTTPSPTQLAWLRFGLLISLLRVGLRLLLGSLRLGVVIQPVLDLGHAIAALGRDLHALLGCLLGEHRAQATDSAPTHGRRIPASASGGEAELLAYIMESLLDGWSQRFKRLGPYLAS